MFKQLSSRRYNEVGARMWVAIVLTNTKKVSAKICANQLELVRHKRSNK